MKWALYFIAGLNLLGGLGFAGVPGEGQLALLHLLIAAVCLAGGAVVGAIESLKKSLSPLRPEVPGT